MKRSDIIKIIIDSFNMPITIISTDSEKTIQQKRAEAILKSLEDSGMLPPGYMKPIPFEDNGEQYPLVPGDFKNEDDIWCTPGVNEWKKE